MRNSPNNSVLIPINGSIGSIFSWELIKHTFYREDLKCFRMRISNPVSRCENFLSSILKDSCWMKSHAIYVRSFVENINLSKRREKLLRKLYSNWMSFTQNYRQHLQKKKKSDVNETKASVVTALHWELWCGSI